VRVTSVTPTVGATFHARAGARHHLDRPPGQLALDARSSASVKKGDQVTITMPDNQTTLAGSRMCRASRHRRSSSKSGGEEEARRRSKFDATPTDPGATDTSTGNP